MRAAILAVGSELLATDRLDTNSLALTEALERHGVVLVHKGVVGDDLERLAAELGRLVAEHDLVLTTGGLGPTRDDLTREAAAAAFGWPLEEDPEALAALEARFASFGRPMAAVNRRQAMVPRPPAGRGEAVAVLANRRGTAPGLRLAAPGGRGSGGGGGGATLFLFPGVPVELEAMIEDHLEPFLDRLSRQGGQGGGALRETAVLKVACVPESEVEQRIAPAYDEFGRAAIAVLARPGEILLRATAAGTEPERRARLAAMTDRLAELVGDAVFTRRADETLEAVVGELLAARGETLGLAESCTGGLVAERLTAIAGSSRYFLGGLVTYSDELKRRLLGVPAELLERHGAVSEPVARAMAAGARAALGTDWAAAVTGIAGPGGGSAAKPVGTVHFAWAGPPGDRDGDGGEGEPEVGHRALRLPGTREQVRAWSAQVALEGLRRRLLGAPADD